MPDVSDDDLEEDKEKVFKSALKHQRDLTQTFFSDFGIDEKTSQSLAVTDVAVKDSIRSIMEKSLRPYVLFNMARMAENSRSKARSMLDDGLVAAVDGTNALDPTDMMTTGFCGCAVGFITSKERSTPVVKVTTTTADYTNPKFIEGISKSELIDLCESLDRVRESQSWPTTFREYVERQVAIQCMAPVVLIDGPIFTQNLSTQPDGRAILNDIKEEADKGRIFIGVIKDINSSWTMTKWCGYCLEEGEGYIIQSVRKQLIDRYKLSKGKAVYEWASDEIPDDYVRVVFRPRGKAFGFECKLQDIPLAIAIMIEDASPTLHHELPMLIETVDAQIRAGFDSGAAKRIVRGKIQQKNLRMGVDITSERDYR